METLIKGIVIGTGFLGVIFLLAFVNAIFISLLWNWLIPILIPGGAIVGTITYYLLPIGKLGVFLFYARAYSKALTSIHALRIN